MAQTKGGQTAKKNEKNNAAQAAVATAAPEAGEKKPHPMKGQKRGKIANYKDIFMAYMIGGVKNIEQVEGAVSGDTLWAAFDALADTDKDRTPLEKYILEHHGPRKEPGTGRGRGAPQVGEHRNYKVQTLPTKDKDGNVTGESEPFIRLPLSTMGVKKGDKVRADFLEGGKVSIGPAAEGAEVEDEEGESEGA